MGSCVFRETRYDVDARSLVDGVVGDVSAGRLADAVVRAGQIESALVDARAEQATMATALTDLLAAALLDGGARDAPRATRAARKLERCGTLSVVPPEGFSYYGLHPLDFAERVALEPLDRLDQVAAIGVRSIGTTLSAMVCAAVRLRGGTAERRTVRPRGHPYARVTELEPTDRRWVLARAAHGAAFVVADEGPGLSGSSLLSVVDALVSVGVARDRVFVLCTRMPDPSTLLAPDAARRWRGLNVVVASTRLRSPAGYAPLAAGTWRSHFLRADARWPACWPWMERSKALSHDGCVLLKSEGLGQCGAAAADRASLLHAAGFGPRARPVGDGWIAYDVVPGGVASAQEVDGMDVDRIADYCAWRSRALRYDGPVDVSLLRRMTQVNAVFVLGDGADVDLGLEIERPVIADARMMPHEWIGGRRLLKVDGTSHGDDHLFPGPTDAAWDLAGAIAEWRLPLRAVERLLGRYRSRSGDHHVCARMGPWLVAYGLYQVARSRLAAQTCADGNERGRLEREADARLRWLRVATQKLSASSRPALRT
jgi:hypothetical protein